MSEPAMLGHERDVFTVLFEFHIEPDQQQALCEALQQIVTDVVSRQPGFVSATLHVSRDKHRVLNYAQWEGEAAFQAFRTNEQIQELVRGSVGQYRPQFCVYDVIFSLTR